MLATILFVVCLASAPDCEGDTIDPMHEKISAGACMVLGQQALAEWIGDHPKYIAKGFKCEIGDHPHFNGKERGA
jgi:hypothetical protein